MVGKTIGLQTGRASADYIHLYHGNAALLTESLEVIQKTSAVILSARSEEPAAEATEDRNRNGASQLTPTLKRRTASRRPLDSPRTPQSAQRRATHEPEYRDRIPQPSPCRSHRVRHQPAPYLSGFRLKELAEDIRSQGVLSPLLVRPLTDQSFEIVAGARRYRAAQMAEGPTVPVRIVNLTDAEALEAQLIENLQRRDVHPLEEAQGFKALLNLEDPKYSIEQIAAKVGKSPAYCLALCGEPHNCAML